jgi:hypothetical protein
MPSQRITYAVSANVAAEYSLQVCCFCGMYAAARFLTIYLYFENKETLFATIVLRGSFAIRWNPGSGQEVMKRIPVIRW